MSYYDTLAEDLTQAKKILDRGKIPLGDDLTEIVAESPELRERLLKMEGGTIFGADIYTAYRLLESFVEEIERLQRELATNERARREQFHTLKVIRETADLATGTDRSKNDPRRSGALGAVQLLVERFNALKEKP